MICLSLMLFPMFSLPFQDISFCPPDHCNHHLSFVSPCVYRSGLQARCSRACSSTTWMSEPPRGVSRVVRGCLQRQSRNIGHMPDNWHNLLSVSTHAPCSARHRPCGCSLGRHATRMPFHSLSPLSIVTLRSHGLSEPSSEPCARAL